MEDGERIRNVVALRAMIDANGALLGTAECVAQRTVLSGAIYGATQKPTAPYLDSGVDFLNYTVPILIGYADGDQMLLTIAYEDDLGMLTGTMTVNQSRDLGLTLKPIPQQ